MADILFISKPIAPPWNDSSKNLAFSLATHLRRHRPWLMTYGAHHATPSNSFRTHASFEDKKFELADRIHWLHNYSQTSDRAFSLKNADRLAVMKALLAPPKVGCWHFFFAPSFFSSTFGYAARMYAGVAAIHTICSAPRPDKKLVHTIRARYVVALSKHTENFLRELGFKDDQVVRIDPSVPLLVPPSENERQMTRKKWGLPLDEPVLIYPGDLEFSSGAVLSVQALADLKSHPNAVLILACRQKTKNALIKEHSLRRTIHALGLEKRVIWAGDTPDIHALLATADIVLFPSETLYAKMDYPLVLLEAMQLGRAVVVAKGTPCEELVADLSGVSGTYPVREDVSEQVKYLIDDNETRIHKGVLAKKYAAERFSETRMALAYESLYDDIV